MAPDVLAWVSGNQPVWVPPSRPGKVLGLGSNLHQTRRGDVVWGTGAIFDRPVVAAPGVTVLATRGPLTRGLLREVDAPEVYGDPAILLPLFIAPSTSRKSAVGVVPHLDDRSLVSISDPSVRVLDVGCPWPELVRSITECELIISSSLHGIIVAEAYGIPAVWTKVSDRLIGGAFKFDDYFLGTGRDPRPPVPWELGLKRIANQAQDPPTLSAVRLVDSWADYKSRLSA